MKRKIKKKRKTNRTQNTNEEQKKAKITKSHASSLIHLIIFSDNKITNFSPTNKKMNPKIHQPFFSLSLTLSFSQHPKQMCRFSIRYHTNMKKNLFGNHDEERKSQNGKLLNSDAIFSLLLERVGLSFKKRVPFFHTHFSFGISTWPQQTTKNSRQYSTILPIWCFSPPQNEISFQNCALCSSFTHFYSIFSAISISFYQKKN